MYLHTDHPSKAATPIVAMHTYSGVHAHIQDVLDLLRRYVCPVQVSLVSCQGAEQHLHKASLNDVGVWPSHASTLPILQAA